ncbi:hypothetical protein BLNAU_24842 [Blattamonas nauphoetae]|uniref:Uncharacterized protein n=1 Tax=Blattamonas nauphoetae TaxID=2049346 RepID=A0ABQ9WLA9_9EUKA|nr:hypothetical protein BLNAU_24842 [Blattamonas nauphoetae]
MPPKKRPCIHSCIQGAHENITQCKLLRQTNFEHGLHQIQPDDSLFFIVVLCDEENRASLAPSSPHRLSANRIAAHRFSTASNSAHPNRHLSQTLQTLARRSPCTTLSDELASLPCKDRCERLFEIQFKPTGVCGRSNRRASGKGGIDACRDQPKQCETRCHTPLTAEQQCQEACRTTFLQCTSVCGTDKNNKTGAGEKACLMQCRAYRSDCRSMCSNSEKEEENGLCGECEASCETDHEICVENCKRNENCIEMCRTQRKDCKEDCHSPNSDYAERKKAEELAKEEERLIGHLGIHSKCEEECDGRS